MAWAGRLVVPYVVWIFLCGFGSIGTGGEADCDEPAADQLQRYEYLQIRMGVPFRITLYAADEAVANRAADRAYERIRQLDRILSDYDPDSEVNQLCRQAGSGKAVAVSPELMFVLKKSLDISQQSDGVFDVTVAPVVSLWRKARRQKKLPEATVLAKALELVDYRRVQLDESAGTVTLTRAGMKLDFGGIAKGYAGDEALNILRKEGITRALIAGSGDIVAGDSPPGRSGWRIGIASLADPEGTPQRFVELCQSAISTSGDTYQFIEIDGIRYSHIVDTRTGIGLTSRRSVTVIAPDGITADSLGTVCCILGDKRGLDFLAKADDIEALFAERHGEKLQVTTTPCFSQYEVEPPHSEESAP
ncbi:MAG: FAD:protein FMN transferase [Planctomycetaceae bacterium]